MVHRLCNYGEINVLAGVWILEKYNCLYNLQFGFCSKHSTVYALISITESIGKCVCDIFVDLQKAFNYDILLDKLHHYDIRGKMNE